MAEDTKDTSNYSTMMAASLGVQAIASIGSAYAQSISLEAQGKYQRQQAEINARIQLIQAEEAIKRGEQGVSLIHRKAIQIKGTQRTTAAAQGVQVDSGAARDLQTETDTMSEIDIQTTRNNAWREAWGFKSNAEAIQGQGRMAEMGANNDARNTLLTGGLNSIAYGAQAASYGIKAWDQYSKQNKTTEQSDKKDFFGIDAGVAGWMTRPKGPGGYYSGGENAPNVIAAYNDRKYHRSGWEES